MQFLRSVSLPNQDKIYDYLQTHSFSDYPFYIFKDMEFDRIDFKSITIFYGSNGSGKSTLINLLSDRLASKRCNKIFVDKNVYEKQYSEYLCTIKEGPRKGERVYARKKAVIEYEPFKDFVSLICPVFNCEENDEKPKVYTITSDDIFSFIQAKVAYNERAKTEIFEKFRESKSLKYQSRRYKDLESYNKLKEVLNKSSVDYAIEHGPKKKELYSNGETCLEYFNEVFNDGGIYILDEPENCLSPIFQFKLIELILDAARFRDCQFIIATHSPLLLSLDEAIIYNLDERPVITQKWYELENVKFYFNFFRENQAKFQKDIKQNS